MSFMNSSLMAERPILISPSLIATIGLEEACLLSVLNDLVVFLPCRIVDGREWWDLDKAYLDRFLPFWSDLDIQRISWSLKDKGIIALASAPYTESHCLTLSFDAVSFDNKKFFDKKSFDETPKTTGNTLDTFVSMQNNEEAVSAPGARLISPLWQPDQELLRQIAQHQIPLDFVRQQVPEFVTYWRERGEPSHSWGAKFLKDLLHKWRNYETQMARHEREDKERQSLESEAQFLKRDSEVAMHSDWYPSKDALEVLVKHASISLAFVEDSIPEFVVYWSERGEVGRTWNSKFIQHVKRQWVRYNSSLEHDTIPKRISENWQPSHDLYDVLKLANIDLTFAQQQVIEFVLFWRESNQVHSSWNTKFLQHVKYRWAKQHSLTTFNSQQVTQNAGQQLTPSTGLTRDRSLAEQLNDRSWASD
jgi:DnaT DNA-binding domain